MTTMTDLVLTVAAVIYLYGLFLFLGVSLLTARREKLGADMTAILVAMAVAWPLVPLVRLVPRTRRMVNRTRT